MNSHTKTRTTSPLVASALLAALMPLAGCLAITSTTTGSNGSAPLSPSTGGTGGVTLHGYVKAGLLPLYGAQVYLYTPGATGYGSPSTSLLDTTVSGILPDQSGNGYVTTDSRGYFSGAVLKSCPTPTSQVYLLATGGSNSTTLATPAVNSAIHLIATLGSCQDVSVTTAILTNEVTTAAAVTSLQQFMADSTHIGTSATNASGLFNSFALSADLADVSTGSARLTNIEGTGVTPQARINTLADIIAPCAATLSSSSSACASLFSAVTLTGASPTTTATALLTIASHPAYNAKKIFALVNNLVPFQPIPIHAPTDYTVGITLAGGGLNSPTRIAIDAAGNAWTTNCATCNYVVMPDSIVGFSPAGVVLSGANGFTAGVHTPTGIAIDTYGNIWSTNKAGAYGPDEILKMTSAGTLASGFPTADFSIAGPRALAVDALGTAWIASSDLNSVVHVAATGGVTGAPITSPGFLRPLGIAIDGSGNIFASGTQSSSVLKINSSGTVQSGSGAGFTGGGLSYNIGIAIDNADQLWAYNDYPTTIPVLSGVDGTGVSPFPGYTAGIFQATDIAIDGAGTAWITNCQGGCPDSGSPAADTLVHLAKDGTILSGPNGITESHFATTVAEAIDPSGNVWVANTATGTLTLMVGIAAPVKTPLAAAAAANQLGLRP